MVSFPPPFTFVPIYDPLNFANMFGGISTSSGSSTGMKVQTLISVRQSTASTDATGDGTQFDPFGVNANNTFVSNVSSNGSTFSNGIFTAGANAIYFFQVGVTLSGLTNAHTSGFMTLLYNGATPTVISDLNTAAGVGSGAADATLNNIYLSGYASFSMTLGDTVETKVEVQNGGKVVDTVANMSFFTATQYS